MSRIKAYITPFDDNGNLSTEVEITRDVLTNSISSFSKQLDLSAFDIGIFRTSNGTLSVRNDHGRYNDVGDPRSIFGGFRRGNAIVRFTYDRANFNAHGDVGLLPHEIHPSEEVDVFKGLLIDDSSTQDVRKHNSKFQILGREVLFDREDVPFALLANGQTVKVILEKILDQPSITKFMTFTAANIVPANNVVVDDVSSFQNKTVKAALNRLLLISNSVFFLDVDDMKVSSRDAGAGVDFTFHGQASFTGRENIVNLNNVKNGLNRVINYFTWKDTLLLEQEPGTVGVHGIREKEIFDESITTEATKTLILEELRDEFGPLKDELDIETPLTYAALDLDLLSRVNIDYPPPVVTANDLAQYGSGQYEIDRYPNELSTFRRLTTAQYKIIKWSVNLKKETMSYTLRRI